MLHVSVFSVKRNCASYISGLFILNIIHKCYQILWTCPKQQNNQMIKGWLKWYYILFRKHISKFDIESQELFFQEVSILSQSKCRYILRILNADFIYYILPKLFSLLVMYTVQFLKSDNLQYNRVGCGTMGRRNNHPTV